MHADDLMNPGRGAFLFDPGLQRHGGIDLFGMLSLSAVSGLFFLHLSGSGRNKAERERDRTEAKEGGRGE